MKISPTAIETMSGKFVDLANPQTCDISIYDIAWALSREPRFCGHTISKLPYSVGQHSIEVHNLVVKLFKEGDFRNLFLRSASEETNQLLFVNNYECPRLVACASLLHDAAEAYLRDLPSPVKALPGFGEAYKVVEDRLTAVIKTRFEIVVSPIMNKAIAEVVHWADLYALSIEAYHLLNSRGISWAGERTIVELQSFKAPKRSLQVYNEFLLCASKLGAK